MVGLSLFVGVVGNPYLSTSNSPDDLFDLHSITPAAHSIPHRPCAGNAKRPAKPGGASNERQPSAQRRQFVKNTDRTSLSAKHTDGRAGSQPQGSQDKTGNHQDDHQDEPTNDHRNDRLHPLQIQRRLGGNERGRQTE